jgi:hypothetical protein
VSVPNSVYGKSSSTTGESVAAVRRYVGRGCRRQSGEDVLRWGRAGVEEVLDDREDLV